MMMAQAIVRTVLLFARPVQALELHNASLVVLVMCCFRITRASVSVGIISTSTHPTSVPPVRATAMDVMGLQLVIATRVLQDIS